MEEANTEKEPQTTRSEKKYPEGGSTHKKHRKRNHLEVAASNHHIEEFFRQNLKGGRSAIKHRKLSNNNIDDFEDDLEIDIGLNSPVIEIFSNGSSDEVHRLNVHGNKENVESNLEPISPSPQFNAETIRHKEGFIPAQGISYIYIYIYP